MSAFSLKFVINCVYFCLIDKKKKKKKKFNIELSDTMLIEEEKKKKEREKLFSSDELHLPTMRYRIEIETNWRISNEISRMHNARANESYRQGEASTRFMIEREKRP